VVFVCAAALALGPILEAQKKGGGGGSTDCAPSLYGRNSASSIGIVAGPGVNPAWISAGIAKWDVCNSDGWPPLLCDQPGEFTFTVQYQLGNNPAGNGGCGSLAPNLFWSWEAYAWLHNGGVINLYERNIFGEPCSTDLAEVARVVGHEIGHALGINESPCFNGIMGGQSTVSADECSRINDRWVTPFEELMAECNASCWTACDANVQCPTPIQHWDGGTTWFDPLVFDLDADGVATFAAERAVLFDLDADGAPERITWPGTGDAFLWTDLNHNNSVDDGAELFGVGMMLPNGRRARHGYEALAMYDQAGKGGNGDGVINSADAVWNRLRLWQDVDHDGVCDAGETSPIHRFGVKEIVLSWTETPWTDGAGTVHLIRGGFRKHVTGNAEAKYDIYPVEALAFRKVD
jgi:hypothetical protein